MARTEEEETIYVEQCETGATQDIKYLIDHDHMEAFQRVCDAAAEALQHKRDQLTIFRTILGNLRRDFTHR